MTSTSRSRGRPPSREQLDEAKVFEVALRAFAERGYDGVSVRELGRELGVSHGLLNARFGSKQDLWFAAMEHTLNELIVRQAVPTDAEDVDDLELLRRGIVEFLVFSAAHPELLRIMSAEGAADTERLAFVYDRLIKPAAQATDSLLTRLAAAGRIRPVPYPAYHFLLTHGGAALFSHPASARHLGVEDVTDPTIVRAHAELVADLLVRALALTIRHLSI